MMFMQVEREAVPQRFILPDRHLKKAFLHLAWKVRPKMERGASESLLKTDCSFAHFECPSQRCQILRIKLAMLQAHQGFREIAAGTSRATRASCYADLPPSRTSPKGLSWVGHHVGVVECGAVGWE